MSSSLPSALPKVLIAIGGNALYNQQEQGNLSATQLNTVCNVIVQVIEAGYLPVITFGNGPQVGNLLDMAETAAKPLEYGIALDICVAWTQGEIGYGIAIALRNLLKKAGVEQTIVPMLTTVAVDPADEAFLSPSKPIGKFISAEEADHLYQTRGWIVGPDSNRGYRRRVPSPRPLGIFEADAIKAVIDAGMIPLCCGGGGVPIYEKEEQLVGIEAVIDKDYTSCLLAKTLGIENMVICTGVDHVFLDFGTPNQQALHQISLTEAQKHLDDGQFAAGSMGPKVAAMMDYIAHGGQRAIITSLENVLNALNGKAGTEIHP